MMSTSSAWVIRFYILLAFSIFIGAQSVYAQPSSIDGFVWYDGNSGTAANDNNGQQNAGEPGYIGARVWLYTEFAAGTLSIVGMTTTDAAGNYQFTAATAFIGANRKYYIAVEDPLQEPGTVNPTTTTLLNVGSDATDNDAVIDPGSFSEIDGKAVICINTTSSTAPIVNNDFGFYTLCSGLTVTLPPVFNICEGETIEFTAVTTGGTGTLGFDWTDNSSGLSNMNEETFFNSGVYGVTVTDDLGCEAIATSQINVERCQQDISLSKTASIANPVSDGQSIVFDIEICNEGQSPLDTVEIYDLLPVGYVLDDVNWNVLAATSSFITASRELSVSNGVFPAGGLLPNDCQSVSLTATIDDCATSDNLENIALINFQRDIFGFIDDSDSTPGPTVADEDDTDRFTAPLVDLALSKTINTANPPFTINEQVIFDINVFNQGTVDLDNIVITDYLPTGLIFDPALNTGWTLVSGNPTFTITTDLIAGNDTTIPLTLLVGQGNGINDWTNIAEISSATDTNNQSVVGFDFDSTYDTVLGNDVGGTPNTDEDNHINDNGADKDGDNITDEDDHDPEKLDVFDLALRKELLTSPPYFIGQDHLYNITVCNQGNIVATNIVVKDYLPNGYSINTGASTPLWSTAPSGDLCTTTVGQLAPGECTVIPLTLTQQFVPVGAPNYINYAEIAAAQDNAGNDMTNNDLDSTPSSNTAAENSVEPDDLDDNNLQGGGPIVGEDEDDHDPAGPRITDVALRKTVVNNGPFDYGNTLSFTIEIINQGSEAIGGVDVVDYVPAGLTFLPSNVPTWSFMAAGGLAMANVGSLQPGESTSLTINLQVTCAQDDLDAWTNIAEIMNIYDIDGNIINSFDIDSTPDQDPTNDAGGTPDTEEDDEILDNGSDGDGDGVTDEDDHDPERIIVYDLALVKELLTPPPFMFGQNVTFNITVENQGNEDVTNIVIEDYIPVGYAFDPLLNPGWTAGGQFTIPSLVAGASTVTPITLTVLSSLIPNAYDNYSEIISFQDTDGVDRSADDADSTPASDSGTERAVLPGSPDDNNLLGKGPNAGEDEDDHDPASIETLDLALRKTTNNSAPYRVNDIITFDIEVCNQGTINPNTIEVIDYVPDGFTFIAANNPDWSLTTAPNGYTRIINGLAAGACTTVSIDLLLSKPNGAVDLWLNSAEISGAFNAGGTLIPDSDSTADNDPNNDAGGTPYTDEDNHISDNGQDGDGDGITDEDDQDPERLRIYDAALTKEIVTQAPYTFGQLLQFDITVYNQGNEDLTQVVIGDYVPAGFDFDVANNPGWTVGSTFTVASLPANTNTTVPIFLTFVSSSGENDYVNFAEILSIADVNGTDVSALEYDSTPGSDSAVERSVTIGSAGDNNINGCGPILGEDEDDHDPAGIEILDLALRKTTSSPMPYRINDIITFDIEVCNQGIINPAEVTVIDFVPDGFEFLASNAPDWSVAVAPNGYERVINGIAPNSCRTITLDLRLQKPTGLTNLWFNTAEISSVRDENGNLLQDSDSNADQDPTNDIGGTPHTDEDNHIDDDGIDTNGDGITDEDDQDPERLKIYDLALDKKLITVAPYDYGQVLQFDITVYNQGNEDLTNIVVEDYVPSGYIFSVANNPTWSPSATFTIPTLAAGASMTIPIFLELQQAAGAQEWFNFAEIISMQDENGVDVSGSDYDSTPASDTATERAVAPGSVNDDNVLGCGPIVGEDEDDHDVATIPVFDLALRKTILTTANYCYGDIIRFQIEVFNQGSETVDATVTDYIPNGLEFVAGNNSQWTFDPVLNQATTSYIDIAPGDVITETIELRINEFCDDPTAWTNRAEISQMLDQDGNDVSTQDIDSQADNNRFNDIGGTPNTGEDDEILDDGTDFDNDGVADEDDEDPAFVEVFDLALTKVLVNSGALVPGQDFTFNITVFNQGNVDATNVVVQDYVPAGFFFDITKNPSWTAAVTSNIAGPIAPSTSVAIPIVLTYQVAPGGQQDYTNYAEILSAQDATGTDRTNDDIDSTPGSNTIAENSVLPLEENDNNIKGNGPKQGEDEDDHDPAGLQIFDVALRKTLLTAGPHFKGDIVRFQIEVFNQGAENLTNVEITDYLPMGLDFLPVNAPLWTLDAANSRATTVIASLPVNTSEVFEIDLQILNNTTQEGWTNIAEVSQMFNENGIDVTLLDIDSILDQDPNNDVGGTPQTPEDDEIDDNAMDFDGDGVTDEDDHDPALVPIYDVALTKELITPAPHNYYQLVQFDITVYNQGNQDIDQVRVQDYLPAGYGFSLVNNPTWNTDGTFDIPVAIPAWSEYTIPLFLTIEQTTGGEEDWINYAEVIQMFDTDGNDQTLNDYDSTLGSNSFYENDVQPGEPFDNEIFGCGQAVGEDEDDHDPAGIEIIDLAARKVLNRTGPYFCSDVITFEIEVYNQGSVILNNIDINDLLPLGYAYQPVNNGTWSFDPATRIVSTTIDFLSPGMSATIPLTVEVIASTAAGDDWLNQVEIVRFEDEAGIDVSDMDFDSTTDNIFGNDIGGTADSDEDDRVDDDGVDGNQDGITDEDDQDPERISIYDVALIKEVVTPAPYTYYQMIDFNITVCNQGNEILNNIVVEDYVPIGFGYDASINAGWNAAREYTVASLAPDDCTVIPLSLQLLQTTGGDRDWANYAEVTSFQDEFGVDRSAEDFDSTPASDSAYERAVRQDDAFDNDLFGNGEIKGEDEDDHDVGEIEIYDLALNKTLDNLPSYKCDDLITFEIEVFNQGNETVTDVIIYDQLPEGLQFEAVNSPTWSHSTTTDRSATTLASLAAGASTIIPITVRVIESTAAGDNWFNTAEIQSFEDLLGVDRSADDIDSTPDSTVGNDIGGTADSDEDDRVDDDSVDGNQDGITDEDDQDPERISIYDVALIKEVVTPAPYTYYQMVDFNITVCNQGNEILNNIVVEDYVPIGFGYDASINAGWNAAREYTVASLAPDACTTIPLSLQLLQTTGGDRDWANYAEVTSFQDEFGVDRSAEDFDSTPASDSAYERDVRQDDTFDNDLFGNGEVKGEDEDDHDVGEIEIYDLALNKTLDNLPSYKCDDLITFEIEVFNQGNETATDIVVYDQLPEGLQYELSNNPTWSHDVATDRATTTVASLVAGASTIIPITVRVVESTAVGDNWLNTAEIESFLDRNGVLRDPSDNDIDSTPDDIVGNDIGGLADSDEDDRVDDDSVDGNQDGITDEDDQDPERISIYDVALIKEVVTTAPYTYYQMVDFNITVCNQGNEILNNIVVEDYVPIGFGYDASINAGWNAAREYTVTSLAPDACTTIPLSLQLLQTTGGDRDWANYAEVTSFQDEFGVDRSAEDFDSTPASDSAYERDVRQDDAFDNEIEGNGEVKGEDEDDHDVGEIEIYDLALNKTLDNLPSYKCDDLITFEIEVFNQGNETATDIVVYDQLPEGLQYELSNNPTWSHDVATDRATTTVASLVAGASTIIPITVRVVESTAVGDNWLNTAEIESFLDRNGVLRDPSDNDIDSTPDDIVGNDIGGLADSDEDDRVDDDSVDGNQDGITDEDDQDPERISIYDVALIKEVVTTAPYTYYQMVDFNITVCNQGNEILNNIVVEDYVPIGFGYDASINAGWNAAREYTVASLAPDACTTIPLSLQLLQTTGGDRDWANYAEVTSFQDEFGVDRSAEDFDSTPASDSAYERDVRQDDTFDNDLFGNGEVKGEDEDDHDVGEIEIYDLALNKTLDNLPSYKCDDLITFEIEVFNQGNETATDIVVYDQLPEGLAYEFSNSPTWSYDATADRASITVPSLLAGESVVLPIIVRVVESTAVGDNWLNTAEIESFLDRNGVLRDPSDNDIDSTPDSTVGNDIGGTADSDEDDRVDDDGVDGNQDGITDEDDQDPERISIYDVALIKEVVTPAPYTYYQMVDFNITVCNQGNEILNNIVVEDYVPIGFGYDASINAGWNAAREYTVASLAPDACTTIPLSLQLLQTTGGDRDWANYAEVTSFQDEFGVDRSAEDFDSTPASDSAYERDVRQDDAFDNEIEGNGEVKGEDEDDHDVGEILVQDLALRKTLITQAPYTIGQDIVFEIEIFNQGNDDARNIQITDYIPGGLSFDAAANSSWSLDVLNDLATFTFPLPLAPGESITTTVTFDFVKGRDIIDLWDNRAEISSVTGTFVSSWDDIDSTPDQILGNDIGGTIETPEDDRIDDDSVDGNQDGITDEDDEDVARVYVFDLALQKVLDTPAPYSYGQLVDFSIIVYNQGNEQATNIELIDYLPPGYSFDPALNPGWTQLPSGDLQYTNIPVLERTTNTTVPLRLEIIRTDGGVKHWTNYTEILSADGPAALGNPSRDVFDIDSNPASDTPYENSVCLPPYNTADDLAFPWDDEIAGCGEVFGEDEDDHDPAGIEIFDLAQIKRTNDPGPFRYGDLVTFQITVFNQGSLIADNVEITDYIPCGLEFIPTANPAWTLSGNIATSTATADLAPGQSAVREITFRVVPCIDESAIAWDNYTEISNATTEPLFTAVDFDSTPDSTNDELGAQIDDATQDPTDEDDHDIQTIDILDFALRKTIDFCGPYQLEDTVQFEITVFNQGNVVSGPITVSDTINTGFVFDPTLNPDWTLSSGIADVVIPAGIAPEDSAKVFINLVITVDADPDFSDWWNYAEISQSTDIDGNIVLDADSDTDRNFLNDNFVTPVDTISNFFDPNDDEITENFPVYGDVALGNDDEDDSDPAKASVVSVIGDYIWKDIDGDGIQDADEPGIEGALVTLRDCDGNAVMDTLSDINGFYVFEDVLPGFYVVDFDLDNLPSGCAFTFPFQGFDPEVDSNVDLDGLTECQLFAGVRDSTIDAGVLILASIGDLVFLDDNGNGIQDFGEPGIELIPITLVDVFGNIVARDTTDAAGNYLFEDVYPGDYYVQFEVPSQYEATFPNQGINDALDSDVDDSNGLFSIPYTNLGSGEDDLDWDLGLYECVKIGETVWYDINTNNIQDSDENGLNGILVNLWRQTTDGSYYIFESLYTGNNPATQSEDGFYKFCAAPGTYYIEVVMPPRGLVEAVANVGFDENLDSDNTNDFGPGTTSIFTLTSGEMKCDLGHGYYPMAMVGNRAWNDVNFNGMQDPEEPSVSGVKVEAYNTAGVLVSETETDEDGQYQIDYLGQQGYYLKFTPPPGLVPTIGNIGDDNLDSDVDNSYGYLTTDIYYLNSDEMLSNVDVGLVAGVLPVDWLDIDVIAKNDFNHLTWSTANEINNDRFIIERKINQDKEFVKVGEVSSQENSSPIKDYIFNDFDIEEKGRYYYRVAQVDYDGHMRYSEIVSLDRLAIDDIEISISPNPAISKTQLFSNSISSINEISILDGSAKLVKIIYTGQDVISNNMIEFDVDDLASGVYTVRITFENEIVNKKLIVLRN